MRVWLYFRRDSTVGMWRVTFRLRGAMVSLPRVIHFRQPEKVRDLFDRYATDRGADGRMILERGFRTRRGMVEVELGEEQMQCLRMKTRPRYGIRRTAA
jgi:hypothetical protein